jgi:hypothetical protein
LKQRQQPFALEASAATGVLEGPAGDGPVVGTVTVGTTGTGAIDGAMASIVGSLIGVDAGGNGGDGGTDTGEGGTTISDRIVSIIRSTFSGRTVTLRPRISRASKSYIHTTKRMKEVP